MSHSLPPPIWQPGLSAREAQAIAAGCEYHVWRSLDSELDLLWRRGFLSRKLSE